MAAAPVPRFQLRQLFTGVALCAMLFATAARFGALGLVAWWLVALVVAFVYACRRRSVGLVGAAISVAALSIVVGLPLLQSAVWDGSKLLTIPLAIVDETGAPVANATVRLRERWEVHGDPTVIPPGEAGVTSTSRADGHLELTHRFDASGRDGPLESTGRVYFHLNYWLQVSAPGKKTVLVPLMNFTGKSWDIRTPLPQTRYSVRLEPT